MTLIKCPECKTEMSDMANACPKCAFPNKQNNIQNTKRKNTGYGISIICIIILIMVFAFYWYEIRPTKIIRQCHSDSKIEGVSYNDCLLKNGIDKKSLFR